MPTQNILHVDSLLTNVSVAYLQTADAFVADKVFPDISVAKQSDLYAIFDRADFNRSEMKPRADSTESAGSGFTVSSTPYLATVYALHKDIGDQQRANADSIFQLDQAASNYLSLQALLNKEKVFASNYMTTGAWATDLAGQAGAPGAGQFYFWDDYINSAPIEDVTKAATEVHRATGFRPNNMVIGREVFDALKLHPDILDRLGLGGSTSAGVINTQVATKTALAALFEVDDIQVMDAIENTAVEGAAEVNAFIGGKTALLYYKPMAPSLWTPAAGYTFSWSGLTGQGGMGTRISKMRMDNLRADRVEIEQAFDMKQVGKDLGTFFTTAVS